MFFRARILKTSVKFLFLTIIRAAFGTLLNIYDGASNNNFHTKKLLVDVWQAPKYTSGYAPFFRNGFSKKTSKSCLKWRFRVDIFSKQKSRNENFTSFGKVDIHIIKFFFRSLTIYLSLTNISVKNDVYRGA